jgi:hypothetical protein
VTRIARYALRAAKNFHIWGRWATVRYALKRAVPMSLLGMAIAFEQIKKRMAK